MDLVTLVFIAGVIGIVLIALLILDYHRKKRKGVLK